MTTPLLPNFSADFEIAHLRGKNKPEANKKINTNF